MNKGKKDEIANGEILLSLPQCDMERPDDGSKSMGMMGKNPSMPSKKSIKTTAKKADLVLFEVPNAKDGSDIADDLWKGRCKILASSQSASIVTPSKSLQLVTVGTSNALIVWNKNDERESSSSTTSPEKDDGDDESPTKRLKTATSVKVTPCRLIQPGGSGSSFLIGQLHQLDPESVGDFFVNQPKVANAPTTTTTTSTLCNLFQVAPNELREALLKVPGVVSQFQLEEGEEYWELVPEEEVLFGQQALVETLCEEDYDFENGNDDDESNPAMKTSLEAIAGQVSRRLLPLLMETTEVSPLNTGSTRMNKTDRSMAISRKTVLLASSMSTSTKSTIGAKATDFSTHRFRPDASKIAFSVLRDLFLKYHSYAWSDLSEQWKARLPLGEEYETIASTTEWIEDAKLGGHGGLIPKQLVFSSSGEEKGSDTYNAKGVLSLVDSRAVLTWGGN